MYVEGEEVIENGLIKFLQTPGHSQCSMCITFENRILTGDHILLMKLEERILNIVIQKKWEFQ